MAHELTLQINGQPRSFGGDPLPSNLAEILEQLKLKADRIAVERNGAIVSRADWASTLVSAGDRLEIVHFVGGGTATRT